MHCLCLISSHIIISPSLSLPPFVSLTSSFTPPTHSHSSLPLPLSPHPPPPTHTPSPLPPLTSLQFESAAPRLRDRAKSVGSRPYIPSSATASFFSTLNPAQPSVKHNINNPEYVNKKLNNPDFAGKAVISPLIAASDDQPVTRKRSQTRILSTEKARESFNEASTAVENLKTALSGKMEVRERR